MKKRCCDIREEYIFLIALVFWLASSGLDITRWVYIDSIDVACAYAKKCAYVLWIIQFLLKKNYTKKDCYGVLIIVGYVLLAYHSVHQRVIIPCIVIVYLSANVDFRKILKCAFLVQFVILIITIFASQANIISNVIWENDIGRVRYDLGYDYCAYPAHILLFLVLVWFSLARKYKLLWILFWLIANTVIYYWTDSRADYILTITAIIGFILLKYIDGVRQIKKVYWFVVKYSCAILTLFSIVIHGIYDSDNLIMVQINNSLSKRLSLGYDAIKTYGFTLFGQPIKWYGMGSVRRNPELIYNYVDCAFLKETLSYGIIFIILLSVGFYLSGKMVYKEGDIQISWSLVISLIYAVFNAHLFWVEINIFVLILGRIFRNDYANKNIRKLLESEG